MWFDIVVLFFKYFYNEFVLKIIMSHTKNIIVGVSIILLVIFISIVTYIFSSGEYKKIVQNFNN